jgi:tRNA-specific 2-thiouridylase
MMITSPTKPSIYGKRVFVGLSGGVDSAVSAALLQKAGYDVTGVFIKVWQPDWIECNWKEERRDAMRVAAHLGIPFKTLDCEKEYKQGVIDYMIAEYRVGRTPNPDVMCNKTVKFGAFYDWAIQNGADFVATGHYARIVRGTSESPASGHMSRLARRAFLLGAVAPPKVPSTGLSEVPLKLLTGIDRNKDQSYFIWTLKQKQLSHILFPVGGIEKPEVRKLATKFRLPNAEKKDSQGLCFIGKVDLKDFLSHYIKTEKGNMLNENGEVVGSHPGAFFFTIGERHGFTVEKKTANDAPYFVIDKDVEQNTLTVSNRGTDESLPSATKMVRVGKVNWIKGEAPTSPLLVRSRYRQELQRARIVSTGITETILEFEKPQDTLTPGQSLVIYDGEECLGGGVIE